MEDSEMLQNLKSRSVRNESALYMFIDEAGGGGLSKKFKSLLMQYGMIQMKYLK